MKRTQALAIAACTCLPLAAVAQTTNLYLVRVQDIAVLSQNNDCVGSTDPLCVPSPSPFWIGNTPSAIAYGKGNLFVGGIQSGTAPTIQGVGETPWTVSVVRVGNVLTTRNFTAVQPSRITVPNTRGYSGLDYSPTVGTGGTGALAGVVESGSVGNIANSIAVYNTVDAGTPALQNGLVVGANWRGNAGPSFDYGFNALGFGAGQPPVALATGRFNFNGPQGFDPNSLATTIATPVYGQLNMFNPPGDASGNNEWRDFDVDPRNGNVVGIANNGVRVATRNADGSVTPQPYSPLTAGTFGTPFVQGQRVNIMHGYGDAGTGDLVVWNNRPVGDAGQPITSVLKFNRFSNGAVITPTFLNPDGTTLVFGTGAAQVNPDGIGFYDFSWDQTTGILFILDAASRKVYAFSNNQPGPCCVGTNCFILPASACTSSDVGGTVSGAAGTACTPASCEPSTACCFPNGTCQVLSATLCASAGGTSNVATTCTPNPCPSAAGGRCCVGSRCVTNVADAAACNALIGGSAGASFTAGATNCNAPGTFTSPCCFADYNKSGSISVQDIFDFLNGWFSTNINADINNSGAISVQDIFDFLSAWFAGGC